MILVSKIRDNKEIMRIIAYVFSGIITTLISIITFKIFIKSLDYIVALSLSWIISVTYAYFATRKKVYNSEAKGKKENIFEYFKFILGRVITYIINLVLLMIAVEIFKFDEFYSNTVITILVIILNYFIGDIMINKFKIKCRKEKRK